jgi:hypothetical protein
MALRVLREVWWWFLILTGMIVLRYFGGPFYPTAPELDWVVFGFIGASAPLGILYRWFREWPLGQDWL